MTLGATLEVDLPGRWRIGVSVGGPSLVGLEVYRRPAPAAPLTPPADLVPEKVRPRTLEAGSASGGCDFGFMNPSAAPRWSPLNGRPADP